MSKVQMELLRLAAARIKPGGRIIYSTCSVEPEENEDQIERFLAESTGFRLVNASRYLPGDVIDSRGFVSLLGAEIGGDGVFAARLESVAGDRELLIPCHNQHRPQC